MHFSSAYVFNFIRKMIRIVGDADPHHRILSDALTIVLCFFNNNWDDYYFFFFSPKGGECSREEITLNIAQWKSCPKYFD